MTAEIDGYIKDLAETLTMALVSTIESFGDAMPEITAARQRLGPHFATTLVEAAKVEAASIMMEYIAARVRGSSTTAMIASAADRALFAVAHTSLTKVTPEG